MRCKRKFSIQLNIITAVFILITVISNVSLFVLLLSSINLWAKLLVLLFYLFNIVAAIGLIKDRLFGYFFGFCAIIYSTIFFGTSYLPGVQFLNYFLWKISFYVDINVYHYSSGCTIMFNIILLFLIFISHKSRSKNGSVI